MPPALSDEEVGGSSSDEQVPAQKPSKAKAKPVEEDENENESEDGNEDENEADDEYVVEEIVGHKVSKGTIIYDVKWQGYENPADRTWEPESNLEGAADVLQEYFEKIGGRPEAGKKRKGRKSVAESDSVEVTKKRLKKEEGETWQPPNGSWEHDVHFIDTVEEKPDPKTGAKMRFAYLVWHNGRKTQHPLKHVYAKCPQKMLEYYENHLVFTQTDDEGVNGDETMQDDY